MNAGQITGRNSMFEDIQQAELAIKAGDTKTGFEILRGYLADNPESERAWWIMSGLVQREERVTCLEQVLRINPNNRFARETLDKLLSSPPEPETKPLRELPDQPKPETEPQQEILYQPERDIELGYPVQAFLNKKGSRIYLTLLDGIQIIQAYTTQADLHAVRDAVQKGELPYDHLFDIQAISQDSIRTVKQSSSALVVHYQDGPREQTLRMPFDNVEKARATLSVLTQKMGSDYTIQIRTSNNAFKLVFSALLSLGSAAFVAATIWTIPQVGMGQAGENWRARMVSRLLESLGYGGLVLICVAMILAALGLSAFLLLKPPIKSEMVKKDN
jgi:hypothetical protein